MSDLISSHLIVIIMIIINQGLIHFAPPLSLPLYLFMLSI